MNERRTDNISTADIANPRPDMREGKTDTDTRREGDGHKDTGTLTDNRASMPAQTRESTQDGPQKTNDGHEALQLIPDDKASSFRERWSGIQTKFVDEPKDSVHEADSLVAEVIQLVAQRFAEERQKLEGQWSSGSDVSTEDLRQALQHYRSFFQRLLAA